MHRSTSISRGALLTVLMRWFDRLVGVVSTLILARILVPEDFGIVAMASIVVGFMDIIFDLGVNVAVIQKNDPDQAFYDTAWTVKTLQATAVAIMLASIAPFAADYYSDDRVTAVVRLMALSIFVSSFENIGIITFQKSLDFVADVKFMSFKRIVSFVTTIALTLILESYWGMVIGALCGRLASTIASYFVHPMRPRFSLKHFSEIFSISQWVLVKNISQYLDRNLHIILVGGISKAGITGGYTLASEISDIPGTDLLAPINRVLFPAFARVKHDFAQLATLLVNAQSVQVMITFPACVGFVLTAEELVPVALGEKWLFIIPFIQILALSNIVQSISSSANYVMTVIGQIRVLALTSWLQILTFTAALLIVPVSLNPMLIAFLRFAAVTVTFSATFLILFRYMPQLSLSRMIGGVIRPTIGCCAMAAVLPLINSERFLWPTIFLLLVKIAVGAALYCSTVIGLWILAKRPPGAEQYFIGKISNSSIFKGQAT